MRFITVSSLSEGMILGRDIVGSSHSFMLKKGVKLTEEYIKYLNEKGYLGAYIIDEAFSDVIPVEVVSQNTLFEGIKAVENSDIDGIVIAATKIVSEISSCDNLSVDICDLRSFDDYTYHHSVNVAVYAVAVGKYMGLKDSELTLLCQAGICHDLGKKNIPLEILNKPGKLSDEEFDIIKSHPKHSYDMLYDNPDISSIVRQAVICHHENENGSGYPFGKNGNQIPLLAKIIHGVDVYDALTSKRPYKEPYSPFEAFEYLMGGKSILFNDEVVEAMKCVIPTYPVGMEVCLSNGENAIVVKNTQNPARPIVRLIESKKDISLLDEEHSKIFITASGFMSLNNSERVEGLNESRQAVKEKKPDIVIVDDALLTLRQVQNILQDDYNVIPLQSGIAAANYLRTKGAPDLIIMDIEMPIIDGITATRNIRKMGYDNLPIIFLSAKGDRETILSCRSVNAIEYIIKPIRPTYLRERVANALGIHTE